uniref:NADH-ubiquinone oxidoreductase chain 4 n=1 Tax=Haematopinus quadripertusus TaxID=1453187 RepID=A0AAU7YR77_9NEOP
MSSVILSLVLLMSLSLWFSTFSMGLVLPVLAMSLMLIMSQMGSGEVYINSIYLEDKLSLIMVLVSFWISISMITLRNTSKYSFLVVLLLITSICFFTVSSWFMFFVFFEFSLLPIFLVLTYDGEQPERIRAGRYMMLYTVFISVPFLMAIVLISDVGVKWIYDSSYLMGHVSSSSLFFFCLVGGFLVKVPLFWLHSWLPKAHVESPLWGSIFLAGVLLKFGIYGLMRSVFLSLPEGLYLDFVLVIAMMGACYSAILALLSSDVKVIVAYSSVSHMNACFVGLMMLKQFSFKCAILVSVAHSLSASLLFYMVTMVYSMVGSRSLFVCKSIVSLYPGMVLFCFLSWSLNVGVPPTLSFMGEFCTVAVVMGIWGGFSVGMLSSIFVNSSYSMMVFGCLCHGLKNWFKKSNITYNSISMVNMSWLFIPQLLLFMFCEFLITC